MILLLRILLVAFIFSGCTKEIILFDGWQGRKVLVKGFERNPVKKPVVLYKIDSLTNNVGYVKIPRVKFEYIYFQIDENMYFSIPSANLKNHDWLDIGIENNLIRRFQIKRLSKRKLRKYRNN